MLFIFFCIFTFNLIFNFTKAYFKVAITMIKDFTNRPLLKDFLLMLLFGTLSFIFGLIKIHIPGLEGTTGDFREIPLLISIFFISNPIFLIGMSAISLLSGVSVSYYFSAVLNHSASLIVSYYFYLYFKKQKLQNFAFALIWFVFVVIYFVGLLLPFSFLFKHLFGLNSDNSFFTFHKFAFFSLRFEILNTALVTSIYLIQFKVQKELKEHKKNLELIVKERTNELEITNEEVKTTNEEIKATNDELFAKNKIINAQNDELIATLKNLKETQTQLFQAEKMASLGVLTAGVAHEINNPLNYILGSYVGLSDYFKEKNNKDEMIQILLSSLKTGVDRAANIVKGLGQFSKSSNTFDEQCDIHSIIDYCLLLLQNKIKTNFKVTKNFSNETILILGNVGKLHQVFINILTNSIQAIENDGEIIIRTQKYDDKVIIEITDNGYGISKENLSKISDPFFTTKEPGEGPGLGLSISYTIINEHNGTISFDSVEDKETIVKITFPLS